ncbi:soj family protein [Roseomonas sp. SSH11]|uniref:Soj family protein n=1 Tax=Pararoseomonas baculiformis TaxID=2820812 RepID=A0ABS4AEM8_9PROT|nr:soj family protein [Pararoseomonas baculiformis]MBP0444699.1 soj family protein [Pararoseomonas baculiformis]
MDTPIAAVLWPDHARRDMAALTRLMAHLERCCLEMGAEDAAAHLAEAAACLAHEGAQRRLAA